MAHDFWDSLMINYFETLEKVIVNNDEFWVLQWVTPEIVQGIKCSDIIGGAHYAVVCVAKVK